MIDDPDFDEMQTTTQRNRGFPPKKTKRRGNIANFEGRKAPPFQKKSSHMDKYADYEGTPEDEAEDRAGAKRMGMSKDEYEGTPQDEAEDRAGQSKMPKGPKGKGGGHMGIAIMISPMSNPAQEHRASIRNSINKAVATSKRKGRSQGY